MDRMDLACDLAESTVVERQLPVEGQDVGVGKTLAHGRMRDVGKRSCVATGYITSAAAVCRKRGR